MSLYGQALYGQSTYGAADSDIPDTPTPGDGPPWLDDRIEYHPPVGEPIVAMFHRDPSVPITAWRGLAIQEYDGNLDDTWTEWFPINAST